MRCGVCLREESLPLNHVFTLTWSSKQITVAKGFNRSEPPRGKKRDYACSILCASRAVDRWSHHGSISGEVSKPRAEALNKENDERPRANTHPQH